jgi:3-(3-hydroxy-phenyl)propionate hydroxylase/6-hydroxy-3-succinoylpyridine 3-monooxygenase
MNRVIIVGGGPVGVVTALLLARAGVPVTLVEAAAEPSDAPRAAVYFWSLLGKFAELGLLPALESVGVRKQDYTFLVRRTGERIDYSLRVLEGLTATPYNLHLGQHQLTRIVLAALANEPDATVRFATRLTALAPDAHGVTVTLETPAGNESLRAAWVIGADGAGSAVRRLSGITFDGMTWDERFIATNVTYPFDAHGYARTTFVIDESDGAVIVNLDGDGLWRCTYMEDAALPEISYRDRLPAAYARLLPGDGAYVVHQASPYRMHQRCAAKLRQGRVLLAGDAAHVTNPTGGLGLTCGLWDAFALAPALSAVVHGKASDVLLDHYAERRRRMFLDHVSPLAVANKELIFHGLRNPEKLETALQTLRRLPKEPDFLRERLQFTRRMATPL